MKSIWFIGIFSFTLLLAGCFEKPGPENGAGKAIDPDTAIASSAPVVEVPDTTLQPVVEVTLRAVGNSMEEMKYDKDTIEARAGALVKLSFKNEAVDPSMNHNVVITLPDKYKLVALAGAKVGAPGGYVPESATVIAASPLALPGQTVDMEFTAPTEPGTYNFVCTYPGHWKRMNGLFVVKPI